MQWPEIRQAYPEQWLVIEALEAHTQNQQRILDRIAVIETCSGGTTALQRYQQYHQQNPHREFYFVHTQRDNLDITERRWVGNRSFAPL